MTAGYLSLTERDREEMLAAIGVSSIDELFAQIPEDLLEAAVLIYLQGLGLHGGKR